MSNSNSKKTRLFISFSSKDIPFVREIMSGLYFQDFDFWDYSDDLQQIQLTQEIKVRLVKEIDECDYFVALVSKHSTDEKTGLFTRFEVDYAINTKQLHKKNRIITIELENTGKADYHGPYKVLKDYLHQDFKWNKYQKESIKSYISLIKSICQATGKNYLPQITPHHRLPFWEKFKDEVVSFSHSNHEHNFLMSVLGEFNEYYKKENYSLAYESIRYFISSCNYLLPEYKLVYPWIVKAVSEQNNGNHSKAKESYEAALVSEPTNADALGGIGMVHLNNGNFDKAIEYFLKASENSEGTQKTNERLNMIIAKISGRKPISYEEKIFVEKLEMLDHVLDDQLETFEKRLITFKNDDEIISKQLKDRFAEQRIFILYTKALFYFSEFEEFNNNRQYNESRKALTKAYDIYTTEIKEENLPDAVTVYYYYLTYRYLEKQNPVQILERAIARFTEKKSQDVIQLYEFLIDHYYAEGNLKKCIDIYESNLINEKPQRKMLINYAKTLKSVGDNKFRNVCKNILNVDFSGFPETHEDYYWNGYANYLLGNIERANYDFERSQNYNLYYSKTF